MVLIEPGSEVVTSEPDTDVVAIDPGTELVTREPDVEIVTTYPEKEVVTSEADTEVVITEPEAVVMMGVTGWVVSTALDVSSVSVVAVLSSLD